MILDVGQRKEAMNNELIECLKSIHAASNQGFINWQLIDDDEKEIYKSEINGKNIYIERLSIKAVEDDGAVKSFLRITGGPFYDVFFDGTEGYYIINEILLNNNGGWKVAYQSRCKKIKKFNDYVNGLLIKQS